jgi:hypothetical protein
MEKLPTQPDLTPEDRYLDWRRRHDHAMAPVEVYGWICPLCRRTVAPWVVQCPCNSRPTFQPFTPIC